LQDRDKSVKDPHRYSAGRAEVIASSPADKLLPLTLTIPPRGGMPPATQPEQKFHRPFEVASRADSNKFAKPPSQSNSTPDRPPPPLLHRSASERNGTVTSVEPQRRQPHTVARLDAKFAADDAPLNLVVGRHGSSHSQHLPAAVNCTNTSDLSPMALQQPPNPVSSDGWRRQRNRSSSLPVVSLLDRKSLIKAAREKSAADGNSSDEETANDEDEVAEAGRLARLLLIMSGPPLEPDNSPSKMKFLQQFGLVTSSRRAGGSEILVVVRLMCLQCFDAVGWTARRASGL